MFKKTDPHKLQSTLDDLKRRLQQEREAAVSLTHHLNSQREQSLQAEDSRVRKLEAELASAQQKLADQQMILEKKAKQSLAEKNELLGKVKRLEDGLAARGDVSQQDLDERDRTIQRLTGERDESRTQQAAMEFARQLADEESAKLQSELAEKEKSSEELVQRITADRDEARAELAEVAGRTSAVEEELVAAERQFREQREAALEAIQQLEAERKDNLSRLSELEARAQWLDEELATTKKQLESAGADAPSGQPITQNMLAMLPESLPADQRDLYFRMAVPLTMVLVSTDLLAMNLKSSPGVIDAVRNVQLQSQQLLEVIRDQEERRQAEHPAPSQENLSRKAE